MYKDITNMRSGRLVAIERTDKKDKIGGCYLWRCKCDCGNYVEVSVRNFMRGIKKSCGCMHRDKSIETLEIANQKLGHIDGTCISSISKKTISKNNTSGVRGVTWNREKKKWQAGITFKQKFHFLGAFEDIEDAAKARKEAEEKYFEKFLEEHKE